MKTLLRGIAIAAVTAAASGCSLVPDTSEVRFPNRNTFLPSSTAAFVGPVSVTEPVAPSDLVDGQGNCSGGGPVQGSPEALAGARSVGLEMSECQVVRSLGPPQSAQVGAENGVRTSILTYRSGDRPGVYRFSGGRLKVIEQGDEPQPAARKPAAKKQQGA